MNGFAKIRKMIQFLIFSSLIYITILSTGLFANTDIDEGVKLIDSKQYKKAIQHFNAILDKDSENAPANYFLGFTYLIIEDHDKAIDYLEKAIDIDDKNADYHFRLAQALGMKTQNSSMFKQVWLAPKVLKEFQKTVELDSLHIGGHSGLCGFYSQAPSIIGGDIEKAEKEAKILLNLDEYQGRTFLAGVFRKKNQIDSAIHQYELV
ncbi:MAG: tetratricopeptide repeat protein, partial [Calditrichia bacterium]|nr:tetratricopeptide repeat protein [Calditrichia bacterium]